MRIVCDDSYRAECSGFVSLDQEMYETFLIEQGASQEMLDGLTVYLCYVTWCGSLVFGFYRGQDTSIHLGTVSMQSASGANRTLIHETRHFIQHLVLGQDQHREELHLPHSERSYEIDAYAFADQHRDRAFITLDVSRKPSTRRLWVEVGAKYSTM